jgi:hypothetical protein
MYIELFILFVLRLIMLIFICFNFWELSIVLAGVLYRGPCCVILFLQGRLVQAAIEPRDAEVTNRLLLCWFLGCLYGSVFEHLIVFCQHFMHDLVYGCVSL